jgi:hypothetical protein
MGKMSASQIAFAVVAAAAWAALFYISANAVSAMGLAGAGDTFFAGFAHPWYAQFHTDFAIHLLLAGAWMIWRAANRLVGLLCAVLTLNLGALFLLPFIAVIWLRAGSLAAGLCGPRCRVERR